MESKEGKNGGGGGVRRDICNREKAEQERAETQLRADALISVQCS